MAVSEDVSYVILYKRLPTWAHGYILPFVILYITLITGWALVFGGLEHLELFFICVAAIGAIDIMTCLACVWSVEFRCFMTCSKVNNACIRWNNHTGIIILEQLLKSTDAIFPIKKNYMELYIGLTAEYIAIFPAVILCA